MNENYSNQVGFFTAYKEIINNSFSLLVKKRDILARALLIPFILLSIIHYIGKIYPNINSFSSLIISIIIAIATHRILLKEEEFPVKWGYFEFGSREFKYLGNTLFIGILCLPSLFCLFIPIIGIPLTVVICLILISRMSLVFPAIALDEEMNVWDSWNNTKNYKLITFFSIIVFPTIITLAVGIVYGLVINFLVKVVSSQLEILYVILDLFITVLVVSTLSSTYKFIKKYGFIEKVEEKSDEEILINEKDGNYNVSIPFSLNKTFEEIKKELLCQYEELGFSNIVINKENLWMIKNPQKDDSYVSLSIGTNKFQLETYNTNKPEITFI
ncbi:MAG: hypothetical protein PHG81_10990 [Aliarcobacter sp.]|nr:hypothetical protein [Aliarcobacter sp.]